MTSQQKLCLEVISRLTRDGVAPTYDQIGRDIGCSKSCAHALVQELVANGRVRRPRGKWRAIEIVEPLEQALERMVAAFGIVAIREGLERMAAQ